MISPFTHSSSSRISFLPAHGRYSCGFMEEGGLKEKQRHPFALCKLLCTISRAIFFSYESVFSN